MRPNRRLQLLFDTNRLVGRLESNGLSYQQAVSVTQLLQQTLEQGSTVVDESLIARTEQERVRLAAL